MSEGKVFRATKEVAAALDQKEIKYNILTLKESSAVQVKYSGDNFSTLEILFISSDDDSDVKVRVFGFVSGVPKDKRGAVLETINAMNDKFRYVKFTLDSDDDLNISYDVPVSEKEVGSIACEMVARFVNIADEAYPEFMKAIWS